MQVLVVEDNVDVAWALSLLLRKLGHIVVWCATPKLAIEAVGAYTPDLVLLDLGLPEMDGYGLAMLLRQHGLVRTPIMALSAQEDDPVKRRAATINAHYVKPVGLPQIQQILANASES